MAVTDSNNRQRRLTAQVPVIGIDGTAGAYESIQKGELTGTVDDIDTTVVVTVNGID